MICPQCGAQVKDGVAFCPNCGAQQAQQAAAQPQGQPAAQAGAGVAAGAGAAYQQMQNQQFGGAQPHYASQKTGQGTYGQQQPTYAAPRQTAGGAAQKPPATGQARNYGTAALICGILGIVFDFIVTPIGVVASIVAVVLGYMATKQAPGTSNGTATAGLVCGIIGLVLGLGGCICVSCLGLASLGMLGSL